MIATFELAAWFTVVGLILGAALASWWYEGALVKAERQYRKRTAEAVAAVRREADESGYRHGYGDGYAQATAVWQQIDEAKGQVRGHMHVVAGGEPS